MTHNIDEIDRRILRLLQVDATQSIDTLAERVGLSRNACWRRMRQMDQQGIIRARVAVVEPHAVGLGLMVLVLVRTNRHDPAWLDSFRKAIALFPEIVGAHRMAGDLDYVLRVRVSDVAGYDAFYQRFITKVDLSDVSASFVMEDLRDTTALPI
ncbi:MAG: Lrp/AsnC family transcriptional regulator [Primorskyibacter sp.]